MILVGLGFIASLFYWIFLSSLFQITVIEVHGAQGAEHSGLRQAFGAYLVRPLWFVLPGDNYFLFSPQRAKMQLEEIEVKPPVADIVVEKIWPNKILLNFREKTARLKVITVHEVAIIEVPRDESDDASGEEEENNNEVGEPKEEEDKEDDSPALADESVESPKALYNRIEQTYFIDESGSVVEVGMGQEEEGPAPAGVGDNSTDLPALPLVFYFTDEAFGRDDILLKRSVVDRVVRLYRVFAAVETASKSGLPVVRYFEVHKGVSNEVIVQTDRGYVVYFPLGGTLQAQINDLVLTLEQIGEEQTSALQYIDLRIENRAYACCNLEITTNE